MSTESTSSEPTPAATVVVLRDGPQGLEALLVRRNTKGSFAGMWVFPGGRVDAADADPDRPDDELAAARRAAARETEEEVGLHVDPSDFVPYAHWLPPLSAPRRFSTWFFLVGAPDIHDVVVDGEEIHEHQWWTPAEVIARRDAGEIELAPPTWVSCNQLAAHDTVASALKAAAELEPEFFWTRLAKVDDGVVGMWHGDSGYEDGDITHEGARHRLWMVAGGWRYERSA